MSNETSKAMKRRYNDGAFHQRFLVGHGIDVGAGADGTSEFATVFRGIQSVVDWDLGNGDAQVMTGIEPNTFDFLVSSHSLEHMADPFLSLKRWIEVVKPDGHLIIVVPDESMYEHDVWPSLYGQGHNWSFTVYKSQHQPGLPRSINLLDLVMTFSDEVSLERLNYIRDFYKEGCTGDQTRLPNAECAIEMVLRKHPKSAASA